MTKQIPLTKGKFALVDDEDYAYLSKVKWRVHTNNELLYAITGSHHNGNKEVLMHVLIMKPPKGMGVDHWNHDGLDNRRCNLRVTTQSINMYNRRKTVGKFSTYKGVTWSPSHNKWLARIWIEKRMVRLGYFDNEVDAAKAFDAGLAKYRPGCSMPNFPPAAGMIPFATNAGHEPLFLKIEPEAEQLRLLERRPAYGAGKAG